MTDAELRGLLLDCLKLWAVDGKLVPTEEGWDIETAEGAYSISRAEPDLRPVRWFLQTPERRAAPGKLAERLWNAVAAGPAGDAGAPDHARRR